MAILNLAQAAKAAHVARSTLYRAIRQGRLSAVSHPSGGRGVDTAELIRVFGPLQGATEQTQQSDTQQDVALLRVQLAALQRENRLLREEVEASRERESKLLDVVSRGLLEAPRKKKKKRR